MRLVLVSGNAHKVRELGAALPGWEVLGWDGPELPPETGTTFLANARGKAEFGRSTGDPEAWVAGEDSGIEVDGLGGAPGVYSARYAGEGADDQANIDKLLRGEKLERPLPTAPKKPKPESEEDRGKRPSVDLIRPPIGKKDPSPEPAHTVPSGAERTVPIECEPPSEGMQSFVFEGAGHGGAPTLPTSTVSPEAVLFEFTVTRVRRDVLGPVGWLELVSYV